MLLATALPVALVALAGAPAAAATFATSQAARLRGRALAREAPSFPTKPGCYVWTPFGCPRQSDFNATTWSPDTWGMQNVNAGLDRVFCESMRKNDFKKWCGAPDVQMLFVPSKQARAASSPAGVAWGAGPTHPKLHFATMGHGLGFAEAAQEICSEAKNMSRWVRFDTVSCFSDVPESIIQTGRWEEHRKYTKGYGLWFWKPAIVQMLLRDMVEGDVLFYVDAASSLHDMPMWRQWQGFFDNGADVFVTQTKYGERGVTTGDVFKFFDVALDGWEGGAGQFSASFLGLKNTARTRMLVDKWVNLVENITLLDDKNTTAANCACFGKPMFDQSLLSMLLKTSDPQSSVRAELKTPGLQVAHVPFHYGDGKNDSAITAWGHAHFNAHAIRGEKVPWVFWSTR